MSISLHILPLISQQDQIQTGKKVVCFCYVLIRTWNIYKETTCKTIGENHWWSHYCHKTLWEIIVLETGITFLLLKNKIKKLNRKQESITTCLEFWTLLVLSCTTIYPWKQTRTQCTLFLSFWQPLLFRLSAIHSKM